MAVRDRAATFTVSWQLRLPYPVRNMLHRWRSMLGMMIGVGIAIGIVMTLLAISKASVEIFTADYLKSGADLYVITRGGTLVPVLPSDTPGTISNARHTLAQIRGLPEVNAALGVMNWSMERQQEGPRRRDEPNELVATMGVDGDPSLIPGVLVLQEGRWLRRSNEIVLGPTLSREKAIGLGDTIRLNNRDFVVVGIGKLRGFGFSAESIAYLDYQAFRQRAGVGDVVNIIAVDARQPEAVQRRIQELGSLSVFTPGELVRQAEEVNVSTYVFSWILSFLALVIGALFIANMLARSVVERRLEFATLRAIGVSTRVILLTVGAEAFLVSLVATAIGVAISLFFGFLINTYVAPPYGLESLYSADAGLFVLVFTIALSLGLISGFFPARQATRVEPVEVLREA